MSLWSEKTRRQLLDSKWSRRFILLALLQVAVTVPILIATLANVEANPVYDATLVGHTPDHSTDYLKVRLRDKTDRVRFENVWFIVYELWKLWLILDGLIYSNSLTVVAGAGFTFFSGALGIMQIIESIKWEQAPLINLHLQIAMTVIVWVLAIPTSFVAFMLTKQFGWDVMKIVGPERRLQIMYYTVQCFTLALKINFFFEVLLMAFYAVCASLASPPLCIAASVLAGVSLCALLVGRLAVALEAHWMISLFSLMQGAIIFINIAALVTITDVEDPWFTMCIYATASAVIVVSTLYIAVRCQIHFGQGLKPFVKWQFLSRLDCTSADESQYTQPELLEPSSLPSYRQPEPPGSVPARMYHIDTPTAHSGTNPGRQNRRPGVEHIDFTEYFDYLDMVRRGTGNNNNPHTNYPPTH